MAYRQLWGRAQWTRAVSRNCEEQGHNPVPCAAHLAEIDQNVAHHAALLDSPEVVAATKAFIDKHLRMDPPALDVPCEWPLLNDDDDGPPSVPCGQDAWLRVERTSLDRAGAPVARTRALCMGHLLQDVLARGAATVDRVEPK